MNLENSAVLESKKAIKDYELSTGQCDFPHKNSTSCKRNNRIRKNTSFSSEKMTSEINDSGNNDQRMEYQWLKDWLGNLQWRDQAYWSLNILINLSTTKVGTTIYYMPPNMIQYRAFMNQNWIKLTGPIFIFRKYRG